MRTFRFPFTLWLSDSTLSRLRTNVSSRNVLCGVVYCGVLLAAGGNFTQAQRFPPVVPQERDLANLENSWHHVEPDVDLLKKLNTLQDLIRYERTLEAATALQAVIDHPSDYFEKASDRRQSLKRGLTQWIETLPKDVIEAYELQFGPKAKYLIEQYRADQNPEFLRQAVRRYFHSAAGVEAASLLAAHHFDRGEFLACWFLLERLGELPRLTQRLEPALTWQKVICLKQLGQSKTAEQLLRQSLEERNATSVSLGGQKYSVEEALQIFSRSTAELASEGLLVPLEFSRSDWPQFRKSPQRVRVAEEFSPLPLISWSTSVVEHLHSEDLPRPEMISEAVDYLLTQLKEAELTVLPAWNPVIVDGRVIVSGFGSVAAFSLENGQLLWKSSSQDRVFEYLQNEDLIEQYQARHGMQLPELRQYILQHLVGDLTAGTLSSDGRQVYAVRNCGLVNAQIMRRLFRNDGAISLVPQENNLLAAFDVKTGALKWEVGGLLGGEEQGYSGHFFQGPPIAVQGKLYVISENGEQIFLSEIHPETGQPQWMQPLARPEYSIVNDRPRRLTGTASAYAEPLLISLTNAGTVLAVDLEMQELRWRFKYLQSAEPVVHEFPFGNSRATTDGPKDVNILDASHWQETAPLVLGNHVLIAPIDSQDLFCCELRTGRLQWTAPREDGLFVEATADDQVMIVGRHGIRCLQLSDGELVWKMGLGNSFPSGRGVLQGTVYHFPTEAEGLMTIDVKTGRFLASTDQQQGVSWGNLLVSGDRLLTLGGGRLTAFRSLTEVQQNVESTEPDDQVSAWKIEGELALHRGELDAGLELLQRAYQQQRSPKIARQITKTLLFSDQGRLKLTEEAVENLAEMMVEAEHSTDIIFRYVTALERLNHPVEAMRVLRRILESAQHCEEMISRASDHRVRAHHLVEGVLQGLFDRSSQQDQAALLQEAQTLMDQQTDANALLTLWSLFQIGSLEADCRVKLSRLLSETEQPLELERHLLWLRREGTAEQSAEATARLARLMLRYQKFQQAGRYLEELAGPLAGQVGLDQKTGEQLLQEWTQEFPAIADWQVSTAASEARLKYEVRSLKTPEVVSEGDYPREMRGIHSAGSVWNHWSLRLLRTSGLVTAYNEEDEPKWQVLLKDGVGGSAQCVLHSEGNLGILTSEREIFGLNAFASASEAARSKGKAAAPRRFEPTWRVSVGEGKRSRGTRMGFVETDAVKVIGLSPLLVGWEQEAGQLACSRDHRLIYRDENRLIVLDAKTGELCWERLCGDGLPPLVWADEQFVYQIDSEQKLVQRLRFSDGEAVDVLELPPHDRMWSLTGSIAVLWQRLNPQEGILMGFDLSQNRMTWKLDVGGFITAAGSVDQQIVVFDPAERKVRVIDPQSSSPVVAEVTTPETAARQLFVVSDAEYWYVHLTAIPERHVQMLAFYSTQDINGPVLAIHRKTGQLSWSRELSLLRWIPNQSAGFPFLVYGSVVPNPQTGGDELPPSTQKLMESKLLVLDKQTGEIVTKLPEGLQGRFLAFEHPQGSSKTGLKAKRVYDLRFSSGTLQIEVTNPVAAELKTKTEAKTDADRNIKPEAAAADQAQP